MAVLPVAVLTYFPVFSTSVAANPDLPPHKQNQVVVTADPVECSFQFNLIGNCQKFTSPATSPSSGLSQRW
jgi:hypothetical protein